MAQFDVWRNGGRTAGHVPYFVEVQARAFAAYQRRLVVPLEILPNGRAHETAATPRFVVEGREVFLNPLQLQSVPLGLLRQFVASLADDNSAARVVRAIDEAISRA